MQWNDTDDFVDYALEENIRTIGFTANNTLDSKKCLVMGRGGALRVKTAFPGVDRMLGETLSRLRAEGTVTERYHLLTAESVAQEVTLVAVQVKRNWWEDGDLEITRESLTQFRHFCFKQKDVIGDDRAVLNCPLIGAGGYAHRKDEIYAMVEVLLQGVPITVFRK